MEQPLDLRLRILGAFFVLTGLTALLAEQIFEKLLSTVVGASGPAATIVLAVYFLGLTLGSACYSRISSVVRRPLLLYGRLEGFVGLWALALLVLFGHLYRVSAGLVQLGGGSVGQVFALRLLVAGLWILPPTFAMGMSFPAVVGALQQVRTPGIQRLAARFYALNLLGAMLGAAAGPYLLFPVAGLKGTLFLIVLLQFGVFFGVNRLSIGLPSRDQPAVTGEEVGARRRTAKGRDLWGRSGWIVLPLVAFASGFLFFGFEVLWTHLIGTVLGTSVYAFANMLVMVLGGLFIGGLASSSVFRRQTVPAWTLPVVILLAALTLSLTLAGWDGAQALLIRVGDSVSGFAQGELARLALAAWLVGAPAAVMGMVYPLLFRDRRFPVESADAVAGILGASSAVGSILGALVTGFALLPALGSEAVCRLYVFVLMAVALLLVLPGVIGAREPAPSRRPLWQAAGLLVLAIGVAQLTARQPAWDALRLTSGANVYFRASHVVEDSRLLFWHEDLFGGITTVIENAGADSQLPSRILLTNGKFQGNDSGEAVAQIGFALIPLLQQPRRGRALVIGLGTGHSAAVVAAAGFERVEIAEISPGIVQAAASHFGHLNQGVLERDNVELHLEDGRNVLLRSDRRYDLITMELTSVWFAGASSLYSREFYELARARLAEGGVFQQWIQFHHIAPRELASAVGTLRSVFDYVTVWFFGGQGILVASDRSLEIHPEVLERLAERPEMQPHLGVLAAFMGPDLSRISRFLLLREDETRRLYESMDRLDIPLNTDGNRYLEYSTPRHNLEKRNHTEEVVTTLLGYVDPGERRARAAQLE